MSGEKHNQGSSYECEKHARIDEEDDDLTLEEEEESNYHDVGSDPVCHSYMWLSTFISS